MIKNFFNLIFFVIIEFFKLIKVLIKLLIKYGNHVEHVNVVVGFFAVRSVKFS